MKLHDTYMHGEYGITCTGMPRYLPLSQSVLILVWTRGEREAINCISIMKHAARAPGSLLTRYRYVTNIVDIVMPHIHS